MLASSRVSSVFHLALAGTSSNFPETVRIAAPAITHQVGLAEAIQGSSAVCPRPWQRTQTVYYSTHSHRPETNPAPGFGPVSNPYSETWSDRNVHDVRGPWCLQWPLGYCPTELPKEWPHGIKQVCREPATSTVGMGHSRVLQKTAIRPGSGWHPYRLCTDQGYQTRHGQAAQPVAGARTVTTAI